MYMTVSIWYFKNKIMTYFSSKNEAEAAAGSLLKLPGQEWYSGNTLIHGHVLCLI